MVYINIMDHVTFPSANFPGNKEVIFLISFFSS